MIVTTTYTVTGTNANGCINITSVTQNVSACTGINAISNVQLVISVYPNPNTGNFIIELDANAKVSIINTLGTLILNEELLAGKNNIDLNAYAKCVYFMKVITDGKQSTFKLIKN